MAGVIGIGGIFLKFKDPSKMKDWYKEVLGMTTNDYGVLFEFNGGESKKAYLQLGTFEDTTNYFGDPKQQSMINFRVEDLETMISDFKKKSVTMVDEMETYNYGKFIHIEDPEGNRIELWEPVDAEFEKSPDSKMPMK